MVVVIMSLAICRDNNMALLKMLYILIFNLAIYNVGKYVALIFKMPHNFPVS